MRCGIFFFIILCYHIGFTQKIQSIVPDQPIVVGTAFQVQFIITQPDNLLKTTPPSFENFSVVSGPNYYKGTASIDGKPQLIQNITYTLVALKTGNYKIGSMTGDFSNNAEIQSKEVSISIIPPPKISFNSKSSYTDVNLYAPSSKTDLDKLVNENLFIKAEANRTSCYVGEPVVVSFKLFSRLQSSSQVIKSPGFYGFSVVDMANINEIHQQVQTIGNKIFNTSVLRKVQLYPSQSGKLMVDKMYVGNEIEFADSIHDNGKIMVEKEISTEPIAINVKPLPKEKPDYFTGAVGEFLIETKIDKNKVPLNEQGKLILSFSGRGNFIQLTAPIVVWPKGIEVFEPTIIDTIDKEVAPLQGKKTYEILFNANDTGVYFVPPVSFSFFDPASKSFITVSSDSIQFEIIPAVKKNVAKFLPHRKNSFWLIGLGLALLMLLIYLARRSKKVSELKTVVSKEDADYLDKLISLDVDTQTDKQVYTKIQLILSDFTKSKTNLSELQLKEARHIIDECQVLIYSNLDIEGKKEELKTKAIRLVQSVG